MSGSLGVHRFLSKREKHGRTLGKHYDKPKSPSPIPDTFLKKEYTQFQGLFVLDEEPKDKDESSKVQAIRQQLLKSGIKLEDPYLLYALRSKYAQGDVQRAKEFLVLLLESFEGIIKEYRPDIRLLGAKNRKGVTCWLDSLLFALFCRLGSFEAMLYNTFDDTARIKLAALLRLWVNMLRSGKLVTTDITALLQSAIAECGWEDAGKLCQHDVSEAFTFLSGVLELPFLTLKMDIYHTGAEDAKDDHKYVTERLLEVAIPSSETNYPETITLEDCLETYFNNRIEVKRYLERRPTLTSMKPYESDFKNNAIHVEAVEVGSISDSTPSTPHSPMPPSRSTPPYLRHRAPSIVQRRFVPDNEGPTDHEAPGPGGPQNRPRKGSVRKEVMMPAWQFFSLIPWYTNTAPTNDAQVASHFSSQRPMLGICLKRYSMSPTGNAIRLSTKVDIPIEVGLPHFIHDDQVDENGPLYGNFKLSLQSVVCHRGNSVDSGHYISLVRGTTPVQSTERHSSEDTKHWLRFDDLATERITLVDIEEALNTETPYLLFYQIVPVDGDPEDIADKTRPHSFAPSEGKDSGIADMSLHTTDLDSNSHNSNPSRRPSVGYLQSEVSRGRSSDIDGRRQSVAFSEPEKHPKDHRSAAVDDGTDDHQQPYRRSSIERSHPHSRSASRTTEKRASTFSKIAGMVSRERLVLEGSEDRREVLVSAIEVTSNSTDGNNAQNLLKKERPRGKSSNREKNSTRERSSNRLGKGPLTSKHKANKPDRDCIVM